MERLTRKVTHLLCKYTSGPKYEAACKWGICSVTSEWIYECVKQVVLQISSPNLMFFWLDFVYFWISKYRVGYLVRTKLFLWIRFILKK